jgi:hypothetical protein
MLLYLRVRLGPINNIRIDAKKCFGSWRFLKFLDCHKLFISFNQG